MLSFHCSLMVPHLIIIHFLLTLCIYIHTHISTPYVSFSSNILISNILGHIFWFDPIHQNPPSYLLINDGFSCYDEVRRRTQALSDQRLIFHQMLTEEQID